MSKRTLLLNAVLLVCATAAQAGHRAPVTVTSAAPFVRLDSNPEAWRLSQGTSAADWRLVDANGQRIPFAAVPDDSANAPAPTWRSLTLFALPPPPPRSDKAPLPKAAAGAVMDLGAPATWRGEPTQLRLQWPAGTPPFQASYRLETSADLQQWLPLGSGLLLSLAATGQADAALAQPSVAVPARPQRYLRLLWDDPERAVRASHAELQESTPAPAVTPRLATLTHVLPAPDADGALTIPLGGPQALRSLRLHSAQGTWVLPMQVQARHSQQGAWQTLAHPVFYRVQRANAVDQPPPIALNTSATALRLLPPKGSALPPAGQLVAEWTVLLPAFVWAQQGQAPYQLEVGSRTADAGPVPLAQLVPDWGAERARLGQAELGAFAPLPAAPEPAGMTSRQRQLLLWAVLGLGVLGLAGAVLSLLHRGHADTDPREDSAP